MTGFGAKATTKGIPAKVSIPLYLFFVCTYVIFYMFRKGIERVVGGSWASNLKPSWGHVGAMLGQVGAKLGQVGAMLGQVGAKLVLS